MIQIFVAILLIAISSVSSWAAVALDGTCTVSEPASCSNCDVSYTVTAGNYLLVFAGLDSSSSTISGATWDVGGSAQAMTELESFGITSQDVDGVAFSRVNPTTGTKTLRVTLTAARTPHIVVCSFSGVDTSDPEGTIVEKESANENLAGSSLAFTLNSGGLGVTYLVSSVVQASFAAGADQTAITTDPDTFNSASGLAAAAYSTTSPLDYTWTLSALPDFWHVVIPINASSTRRPVSPMVLQ